MKKLFKIKKDGSAIVAIYDDVIPLNELGENFDVERVSNIEFDNKLKKWTVVMTKGDNKEPIIITDKRADAYEQEVAFVNENIDKLAAIHFPKSPTSSEDKT